jgi:hypothetical protein
MSADDKIVGTQKIVPIAVVEITTAAIPPPIYAAAENVLIGTKANN